MADNDPHRRLPKASLGPGSYYSDFMLVTSLFVVGFIIIWTITDSVAAQDAENGDADVPQLGQPFHRVLAHDSTVEGALDVEEWHPTRSLSDAEFAKLPSTQPLAVLNTSSWKPHSHNTVERAYRALQTVVGGMRYGLFRFEEGNVSIVDACGCNESTHLAKMCSAWCHHEWTINSTLPFLRDAARLAPQLSGNIIVYLWDSSAYGINCSELNLLMSDMPPILTYNKYGDCPLYVNIPDPEFSGSNGYTSLRGMIELASRLNKWPDKRPMAVWRGSDWGLNPRRAICRLSNKHSGLIDAKLTSGFANQELYASLGRQNLTAQTCDYQFELRDKLQLDINGWANVCPYIDVFIHISIRTFIHMSIKHVHTYVHSCRNAGMVRIFLEITLKQCCHESHIQCW